MAGIMSSSSDYTYACEGVGLGRLIIKQHAEDIETSVKGIARPEVMGGETGEEFNAKLRTVAETIMQISQKYSAISDKVNEIAAANGAFIQGQMADSMESAQKRFNSIADEINAFKGKGK